MIFGRLADRCSSMGQDDARGGANSYPQMRTGHERGWTGILPTMNWTRPTRLTSMATYAFPHSREPYHPLKHIYLRPEMLKKFAQPPVWERCPGNIASIIKNTISPYCFLRYPLVLHKFSILSYHSDSKCEKAGKFNYRITNYDDKKSP